MHRIDQVISNIILQQTLCRHQLRWFQTLWQVTPAGVAALGRLTRLSHLVISKWGCAVLSRTLLLNHTIIGAFLQAPATSCHAFFVAEGDGEHPVLRGNFSPVVLFMDRTPASGASTLMRHGCWHSPLSRLEHAT